MRKHSGAANAWQISDRKKAEGIIVDANDVSLYLGTPVVCHGLKNASHLNGKIGDVRERQNKSGRYLVHFEDSSLKPCLVKHVNVRILFDLPEKA